MKRINKALTRTAFLLFGISMLAGCGGGGGSSATTTVILKLATVGTPSASLSGIGVTVALPGGVTPALNADGSVAATVFTVSGVALPGTALAPVYTPASGGVKGTLNIVLASGTLTGFGAGEFATLVLNVATGVTPLQSDFTLSAFNPIDISGNTASGLTATVSSLSL